MTTSTTPEQCSRALLPGIATDGRTNGLTESITTRRTLLTFRNARARMQQISSAGAP